MKSWPMLYASPLSVVWHAASGALLTSFYMFRLIYLTFYGTSRMDHHTEEHVHESRW